MQIYFLYFLVPLLKKRTILRAKGFGVSPSSPPSPASSPFDTLNHTELSTRFNDVLDHFAQLPSSHPSLVNFTPSYTPSLSLLRGRLPDLLLARTRLGPSTVPSAGRGLFATRPITASELITLFPGDALLFRDNDLSEITGVLYGRLRSGGALTSDESRAYEVRVSATHSIVGDPELDGDMAYLAHFANDKQSLQCSNKQCSAEERTEYSRESALAANAIFEIFVPESPCHLGLFATRDIAKGEEVFVSYTEGYWLSRA